MLIASLSNEEDGGGKTALVEFNNSGDLVRTVWMHRPRRPPPHR